MVLHLVELSGIQIETPGATQARGVLAWWACRANLNDLTDYWDS
jgi:hypothetical protein